MKTGILAVSFGTSNLEALENSIVPLEREIATAFPDAVCYRAFTSGTVRKILKHRWNMETDSVEQALERMKADNITHAVIFPALVIPGDEYEGIRSLALSGAGKMKAALGLPLLWDDSDLERLIMILKQSYPQNDDAVLLAMGHGTQHACGCLYSRLSEKMKTQNGAMTFCTVEGKPDFQDALRELSLQNRRRVHLVPLLLTAGVHTREDMAGEEPVSLRSLLEREGFSVSWSMQGLGEIPAIREMYIRRVKDAYRSLENTKGGLF